MAYKERYNNEKGESFLEKEILSPYTHIIQVPGKQMRNKIIMALNYWLQISEDRLKNALDICDMLHVSGLLIDDVQDSSNLRRGLPAAHCVYGVPLTINAAFFTIFTAINKGFGINQEIPKIVTELLTAVLRGQGMEIYWRDNFICPTEEHYMKMIDLKAKGFFDIPYQIMQQFSDNKTDYSKFISLLGCYFQCRDDYCNLFHQEGLEESPIKETEANEQVFNENNICEDITEGKFSLPIIHALQKPEDILKQRTDNVLLKKHCLLLLEQLGSLQYTREKLTKFDRQVRAEMSKQGGNPLMEAVLDELLSWQR